MGSADIDLYAWALSRLPAGVFPRCDFEIEQVGMVWTFQSHSCLHGPSATWTNLWVFSNGGGAGWEISSLGGFLPAECEICHTEGNCSGALFPPDSFLPSGLPQKFKNECTGWLSFVRILGISDWRLMKSGVCLVHRMELPHFKVMEAVGFFPLPGWATAFTSFSVSGHF